MKCDCTDFEKKKKFNIKLNVLAIYNFIKRFKKLSLNNCFWKSKIAQCMHPVMTHCDRA